VPVKTNPRQCEHSFKSCR